MHEQQGVTRREALAAGLAGLGSLAAGRAAGRRPDEEPPEPDPDTHICTEMHLTRATERAAAQKAAQEENPDAKPVQVTQFNRLVTRFDDNPAVARIVVNRFDALLGRKKWKNGKTLNVAFLDGAKAVQDRVMDRTKVWEEYANIKFDRKAGQPAHVRVSFRPGGSWSHIGTDSLGVAAGQPSMNLGWLTAATPDDEVDRVVLHEFGHALGLIHEHQHPDAGIPWNKAAVYRYYAAPPNKWDKALVDTNIFKAYDRSWLQYSVFDAESIMLYAIPAKLLTDPGKAVDWNKKLSVLDQFFIAQRYPKA